MYIYVSYLSYRIVASRGRSERRHISGVLGALENITGESRGL
jgi:hypothetical protein